ncbi:hypothetical protein ACIQOV_16405, partial [Kitasatospora sp. NPDC091257]
MSTEREVGPAGPQGEQPAGQGAAESASEGPAQGGHQPTMAFRRVPEPESGAVEAAPVEAAPPVDAVAAEGVPAEGGHKPTVAFTKGIGLPLGDELAQGLLVECRQGVCGG